VRADRLMLLCAWKMKNRQDDSASWPFLSSGIYRAKHIEYYQTLVVVSAAVSTGKGCINGEDLERQWPRMMVAYGRITQGPSQGYIEQLLMEGRTILAVKGR
jgi:hypothetical protein